MIARRMGAYSVFATIFSFFLPPIGFLMAFFGFWEDRKNNESVVGWTFLMVISVLMTVLYIILFVSDIFVFE